MLVSSLLGLAPLYLERLLAIVPLSAGEEVSEGSGIAQSIVEVRT